MSYMAANTTTEAETSNWSTISTKHLKHSDDKLRTKHD